MFIVENNMISQSLSLTWAFLMKPIAMSTLFRFYKTGNWTHYILIGFGGQDHCSACGGIQIP